MFEVIGRHLVVASALALAARSGCETPRQTQPGPQPNAGTLRVCVQDAHVDYATLRFEVDVNNPALVAWSVQGMRYGLTSGANMFLSATRVPKSTVGPGTTQVISFTHQVVYERLLRALEVRPGATVPFTMEARLLCGAPDKRQVQLPVHSQGTLFLPPTSQAGHANRVPQLSHRRHQTRKDRDHDLEGRRAGTSHLPVCRTLAARVMRVPRQLLRMWR